jgi:hypothetical protein
MSLTWEMKSVLIFQKGNQEKKKLMNAVVLFMVPCHATQLGRKLPFHFPAILTLTRMESRSMMCTEKDGFHPRVEWTQKE